MGYLSCPRCHLRVLDRILLVPTSNCPRCLGKTGARIPLSTSSLPDRELRVGAGVEAAPAAASVAAPPV